MLPLRFVGWHNLWLSLSSVFTFFDLLAFFLDGGSTLCCLLDVRLRVPVHVQAVCTVLSEEESLEKGLEFSLRQSG
jgi:hypothetical protein